MKKISKKISIISCSLVLSIAMAGSKLSNSYAYATLSPWIVKSKTSMGISSGAWQTAVTGRGGKGVKLSVSTSKSVSNTLTGSIKASKSTIEGSLGYTTGKSFSRTVSYSIDAPNSKKTYTIKYRPMYKKTKINQQRHLTSGSKIISTESAIAYGNQFSYFDYTWSQK